MTTKRRPFTLKTCELIFEAEERAKAGILSAEAHIHDITRNEWLGDGKRNAAGELVEDNTLVPCQHALAFGRALRQALEIIKDAGHKVAMSINEVEDA